MQRQIFMTYMLYRCFRQAWSDWRSWWGVDFDAPYCCPGTWQHECGCGGMTNREAIKMQYGIET